MAHGLGKLSARRIAVIGNAGGGKSTLARHLAATFDLPYVELDCLLWRPDWQLADPAIYAAEHGHAIAAPNWVIDGLGSRESLQARLARATEIILVDLPLWVHFWLAAERQIAWSHRQIEHAPAGAGAAPPTELLFRAIWKIEETWMPGLRHQIAGLEKEGAQRVTRITSLEQLNGYTRELTSTR